MYKDMQGVMVKFPYVAGPVMSLEEALFLMKECRIRHLPIVNQNDIVGVVSERDILAHQEMDKSEEIRIGDIMTSSPFIVNQYESLAKTVEIMIESKFGSALVTNEEGHLIGIFTTIDALGLLLKFLENDSNFNKNFKNVITLKQAVDWV